MANAGEYRDGAVATVAFGTPLAGGYHPGGANWNPSNRAWIWVGVRRVIPPPFPLPAWDPVGDSRARLDDAEALPASDRDVLERWCDDLAPRIDDLNARTPPGLVHGDAHVGNLLRDQDGRVVLRDFDPTCLSPWQVDLVAIAVPLLASAPGVAHEFHTRRDSVTRGDAPARWTPFAELRSCAR